MGTDRNGLLHCIAVAFIGCILGLGSIALADEKPSSAKYRRPVGLLLDESNEHLLVACSGTGELEVFDTRTNRKQASFKCDESMDSLVSLGDHWIAACSTKSHRTHLFRWTAESIQPIAVISNSHSPVKLHWDSQTQTLFVACLWSRRVESIKLSDSIKRWEKLNESVSTPVEKMKPDQVWDVPIAPREMLSLGDGRGLMVADSFGREVLILDQTDGHAIVSHDFFGTSVRGLARGGKDIVTLHAMLNEFSRTDQNEIHWGVLMANDVRLIDVDLLLKEKGDRIYVGGRVNPVGVPGNGAAEPTSLAVHTISRQVAVSVGGTDMVAIGRTDGYTYQYVAVGKYPAAVCWSANAETLFVANQFDDSISVVDVSGAMVTSVISQGAIRELTEAELGEQLFHSATLSHDRWLTCASCHVDGHTNGQLSDNFGDRSYGAPKRVPSLLGVSGTAPYTWLGHEPQLKGQIVSSVRKTMHSYRKLDDDEVEQIASFMESLPPVVSLSEARGVDASEMILRGKKLFENRGCVECHAGTTYTSNDVYDVGLVDENRQKYFNPPSLRGVSQRGPELFHDGRASGLRGVLIDKKHRLEESLSEQQLADLIAFLNSI